MPGNRPLLIRKDGHRVPISESGAPLHDTLGNITGVVLVFRDQSKVIEAKRVEEVLQRSLQTSDDLVRAIPSGLFIYQYQPPDRLVLISGNPEAARITDIVMPELKCLFMSGYTATVIARQGFLPEGINFLQKPFMKKDLALKLHRILAE